MANAVGTCPVCGLDQRLTPARQLVASHVVKGQKCNGSGAVPTKVVQPASAPELQPPSRPGPDSEEDWTGRCRVCGERLLVTGPEHRIVDHQRAGRRCTGSGHLAATGSTRTRMPHRTDGKTTPATQPVSGDEPPARATRRRLAWSLAGVAGLTVTALLVSEGVADHRAGEAKARVVARTAARCKVINDKAFEYVTSSGVSAGGKEWAQATLDAWPAGLTCDNERHFLEEMASGVVDARLSKQATADTPDRGDCERRIAALMDLDIDEQSRRDNVDAVRIDCNMPPLQQDPFWQEAWARHQRTP